PPFADDAGGVVFDEDETGPVAVGDVGRVRHRLDLAAPDELRDVARPVERTVHDLHRRTFGTAPAPFDRPGVRAPATRPTVLIPSLSKDEERSVIPQWPTEAAPFSPTWSNS